MVLYDGIVEKLQTGGGITVVFSEIISRVNEYEYISYDSASKISDTYTECNSRILERYRDVLVKGAYDIFHSTYYRLCTTKIPTVTTVHDFTYEKYATGLARWVHIWQKNRAIKGSDKIICVSENTANDLLQYCPIDESRIVVVYNGVSDDYFPLEPNFPKSNEVVFVGARGGYKNFFKAVDAIALCEDLSLSIVGGGELNSKELAYLTNKIKGRFQWLGWLSNENLNIVYNRAHCLIYPSSYEGFGIPLIEAMRAGCPVIAFNSSSIPEVTGNAALLIDTLDSHLIAEGFQFFNSLIERNRYIQAGLINSQRFSWDRCYQETNKVYRSLT